MIIEVIEPEEMIWIRGLGFVDVLNDFFKVPAFAANEDEFLLASGVPEFKEEEEKIVKKSDIYFNVQGIDPHRERLNLGYTSDPVAWCLNSNGWDINKLIFVAMVKK